MLLKSVERETEYKQGLKISWKQKVAAYQSRRIFKPNHPWNASDKRDKLLPMHILLVTFKFNLPGCSSLKEKRQRLRGLQDKFGKVNFIAATESAHHDNHQQAEWQFVIINNSKTIIDQQLNLIETHAANELDAILLDSQREWL